MDVTEMGKLDMVDQQLLVLDEQNQDCKLAEHLDLSLYWRFIIDFVTSLAVLVILSVLEKRRRLYLNWCFSRPALPSPMNFLVDPVYRFPYIMIFGVLAIDLIAFVQDVSKAPSEIANNMYLDILYKILIVPLVVVVITGIKYFPLLACVQAKYLFTGHCIGLVSSFLWFAAIIVRTLKVYYSRVCVRGLNAWDVALVIFEQIPIILTSMTVVLWYLYKVISETIALLRGHKIHVTKGAGHLLHVKKLLSKESSSQIRHGKLATFFLRILKYFKPYRNYVKFPLPFVCAISAMIGLLYQISVLSILLTDGFADGISLVVIKIFPLFNLSDGTEEVVKLVLTGVPTILSIVPFVALVLCGVLFLHMMSSIGDMLKRTAKYGFTEKLPSTIARLPKAWEFLGIQMGLYLWAWFIYYLLALIVCILVGMFISTIILGFKYFAIFVINGIIVLIVPVIWSEAVFYAQYILAKYIFFEDATGNFISITNLKLFNWFSYVLFLYNGFAGVVGAILRIVYATAISVLLLFRLDIMILPHGFDAFDSGHRAFLSFFSLHCNYNNDVLHTFVYLMKRFSVNLYKERKRNAHQPQSNNISADVINRRVRNRWLVAYTLLRNPSIKGLTASNLAIGRCDHEISSNEDHQQLDEVEIQQNHMKLPSPEERKTDN